MENEVFVQLVSTAFLELIPIPNSVLDKPIRKYLLDFYQIRFLNAHKELYY